MAAHNPYLAPDARVEDAFDSSEEYQDVKAWSASGRIGRVRYLAYSMGIGGLIYLAGLIAMAALLKVASTLAMIVFFGAVVAMLVLQVLLTIQRSHDFDMSGWLSLLYFVPFGIFLFMFWPGTDGPNRWGNKTPPNSKGALALACAVPIAVVLIGILAAIAIPAYKDYAERARHAQGQTR